MKKKLNLESSFRDPDGYLYYYQISSILNIRLEPFKNLFFDVNYQYKYRKMPDDYQKNQYFFIKTSYNFKF